MNARYAHRTDAAWGGGHLRLASIASPSAAPAGHRSLAHAHAERPASEDLAPEDIEILRREAVA